MKGALLIKGSGQRGAVQTLYKLTDAWGTTSGGIQWGENITHAATGSADQPLCSDGWIHAYEHPDLAVLLNPIHGQFIYPRLWEARGVIGKKKGQTKCGCRELTTVREVPLPRWSIVQSVAFGILCALEVCKDPQFVMWAERWLSGVDRTEESAAANRLTSWAVCACYAALAAKAAACYSEWADHAALAATEAAHAARKADLDLIAIAEKAKQVK